MAEFTASLDLKNQLKACIDERKQTSGQKQMEERRLRVRGGFLTHDDLRRLFTRPNVMAQLRQDFPDDNEDSIGELYTLIRSHGSKMYAILIWIGESKRVKKLMFTDKVDDGTLFRIQESDEDIHQSYCKEKTLAKYGGMRPIAQIFYENQWIVPPTLPAIADQIFPPKLFVFPFEKASHYIDSGSYGKVCEMKIADGFLNIENARNTNMVYKAVEKSERKEWDDIWREVNTNMVYKAVEKPEKKVWDDILREVNTLRNRTHKNIVPLLSSFRAGREYPLHENDDELILYMIHPRANGTLEQWMKHQPRYLEDEASRRSQVYDMMSGLVSALTCIHGLIGDYVAFHHDLKPSNILGFNEGRKFPTWKICDFGTSNIKEPEDTGTWNPGHTYEYTPPEYYPIGIHRLGRAWDVFSMGCICLELATILQHGWDTVKGLPEFKKRRLNNDDCPHPYETTRVPTKQDFSFFNNMATVRDWAKKLRAHQNQSPKFDRVLELVSEMLHENREERIFAFEVEIYMLQILNDDISIKRLCDRLDKISHQAKTPTNGPEKRNNPLRRAIDRKMDPMFQTTLERKGWNVDTPTNADGREGEGQAIVHQFSTLPSTEGWKWKRNPGQSIDKLNSGVLEEFGSEKFYGREEIDEKLRDSFCSPSGCVALYGFWGIGKSHLAFKYADRLQDSHSEHEGSRKHTFWVSVESVETFQEDYQRIARVIGLSYQGLSLDQICRVVKHWLDKNSGIWFLVIDGLDLLGTLNEIRAFLPNADSGQMLFTTKNRQVLSAHPEIVPSQHCFHVDELDFSVAGKIFNNSLYGDACVKDEPYLHDLLRWLTTPLLMKLAAKRMSVSGILGKPMCEDMQTSIVDTVKDFHETFKDTNQTPQFMEMFLKPMIGPNRRTRWRVELRLLCVLACFHTEDITFGVIKHYNERHYGLREYLGTLKNCSLIKEKGYGQYNMSDLVREGVLAWIRNEKGEVGILQRYYKMLDMLAGCYNEEVKKISDGKEWSYMPKRPLTPHFENFRLYIKSPPAKTLPSPIALPDNIVHCIVTFSHGYMDDGKYEQAIHVLEFAKINYKGSKHKHSLRRTLFKAYVSYLSFQNFPIVKDKLLELTNEMREERKHGEMTYQGCELILDLARGYRLQKKWNMAEQTLNSVECLHLNMDSQGVPVSPVIGTHWDKKSTEDKNWLAVRAERERGNYYLSRSVGSTRNNERRSPDNISDIQKARDKFINAKTAAEKCYPHKRQWIVDTNDLIAKALLKSGTAKELDEAKTLLDKNLAEMGNRVSPRRVCETELLLARVEIESKRHRVGEVISTLEKLHLKLQDRYGKGDKAVHECSSLLRLAHSRHEEWERFQRRILSAMAVFGGICLGVVVHFTWGTSVFGV